MKRNLLSLLIPGKGMQKKQTFPLFSLLSTGTVASWVAGAARFLVIVLICAAPSYSQEYWTVSHLGVYGTNYDIGRDNNGNVHIIWLSGSELYYGRIVNRVIVSKEVIPRGGTSIHVKFTRPRLAVRPDGTSIHTSWIDYYSGGGRALRHAWRDSGGTWHNEQAWSNGGGSYYIAYPSAGADLHGNVHIIAQKWSNNYDTWYAIYGRKSGGSWSWNTITSGKWRQQVGFTDKNGGFHATWRSMGNPGEYRYCPSGGNLLYCTTRYIPIVPGTNTPSMGDLFVTDKGDVHNAFISFGIGQIDYYVKRAGSNTFGELSHPSNGPYYVCDGEYDPWPAVIADDSGHIVVAYSEKSNCPAEGFNRLMVAFYQDGTWTRTAIDTTANIDGYSKPAMTIVNNIGYLVWRDSSGELLLATSISTDPEIALNSPNGGEVWEGYSTHNITWSILGTVGNVKIEYSTNNGSNWTNIVSSTINDGSYPWNVPNTTSSQCLVRIEEASDGNPSDTSDSTFSIVPAGTQTQLSLSRTQLNFGYVLGGDTPPTQSFFVSNKGSGTSNWSVNSSSGWLSWSPSSGTDSGEVTVSINPSGLTANTYTGSVTVSDPNATNSPQVVSVTLKVYNPGGSGTPFGWFATPIDGATVSSSVPVTGWALDDVGIESVNIFRKEGGAYVYIGGAVFVDGARPDVEQAYPGYPMNYQAGWGYMMLTNFLPNGGNGTFTLYVIATDKDGHQITLGTKTITCDNVNAVKPFGAIDTPTQGGTASENDFINHGWALTPMPNSIPTNGSTINVIVDGVNLGHPTYNNYRADIAELFPGYANSGGGAGHFEIDTTAYANGVHTIAWTATDNAGNSDGIGSRYFTIRNIGVSSAVRDQWSMASGKNTLSKIPLDDSSPVEVIKGYNRNVVPLENYPDENGNITIEIRELERIEIHLNDYQAEGNAMVNEDISNNSKFKIQNSKFYYGYQVVGPQLRIFPIGSFLDPEKGIFYWQPGPGFIGEYRLVFVGKWQDGEIRKREISIRIVPKFQKKNN